MAKAITKGTNRLNRATPQPGIPTHMGASKEKPMMGGMSHRRPMQRIRSEMSTNKTSRMPIKNSVGPKHS